MPESTPPCAEWELWEGPEIEGKDGIGVKTLFVRRGDAGEIWRLATEYSRVWFCAEFQDWTTVRNILNHVPQCQVCLEVNPTTINLLPGDIFHRVKIYFKTGLKLKPGDHIAIGARFEEEIFRVGDGAKVQASEYFGDKRIW